MRSESPTAKRAATSDQLRIFGWHGLRLVEEPAPPHRPAIPPARKPPFSLKQILVLKSALLLLVMMGLFPPWKESVASGSTRFTKDRGYQALIMAPKPYYHVGTVGIDYGRLALQGGVLMLATVAGLVLTMRQEIPKEPLRI